MGSDNKLQPEFNSVTDFNPRSPHGERRYGNMFFCFLYIISIHAPRMGSDSERRKVVIMPIISIHAPRMGSDPHRPIHHVTLSYFNPRSPHGERLHKLRRDNSQSEFQSTLPAWGATRMYAESGSMIRISIHAPRMGSDTVSDEDIDKRIAISIHAPRMGSDRSISMSCDGEANFNPRSPHGERPDTGRLMPVQFIFQSTLPAWGAT